MIESFGNEFFPTPLKMAVKMMRKFKFHCKESFLEPSAGKGDLAGIIKEKIKKDDYRHGDIDLDVIENEPNLQQILKGKGYRVVHNDFLTFDTLKCYDYIIMNPPFSHGAEHLNHALKFLKPGGTCVCLLNSGTYDNRYTNLRKALFQKLEDWGAEIERIAGAFKDAERPTGVEVVLVTVTRPIEQEKTSILLDGLKKEEEIEFESRREFNALVDSDPMYAAIARFRLETKVGLRILEEYEALKPFLLDRLEKKGDDESMRYAKPLIEIDVTSNKYIRETRKKYWEALFENPDFTYQLPSKLRESLYGQVQDLADYDFSDVNILALRTELSRKLIESVEKTIIDLFDELSRKHSWYDETSKNIHYFNGWKTNKAWKINRKVILPLQGHGWSCRGISFEYHAKHKIDDIILCLAFLDGGMKPGYSSHAVLQRAEWAEKTKNIFLKYIDVTFYKKGTTHIYFRDEEILHRLNIFGCQKKGWLPPVYGKKSYDNMSKEEQAAVLEFEGEESYRKTYADQNRIFNGMDSLRLLAPEQPASKPVTRPKIRESLFDYDEQTVSSVS